MRRVAFAERPGWLATVQSQGLGYAVDRSETGDPRAYWHEAHAYELAADEVDEIERVTEQAHRMCVEAAGHLLASPRLVASLDLAPAAVEFLAHSLATERDRSLYGRFDLVWHGPGEGSGPAKILEYNADTPAGLVEAAVVQWSWLEDRLPDLDQCNLVHERLVQGWGELAAGAPGGVVHLAYGNDEPGEDWCTVAYLADTAAEAGLEPVVMPLESLGWDRARRAFVDVEDRPVHTLFAMYPWEWLLAESFGRHLLDGSSSVRWLEPAWKCLLSAKTILVALAEIYPGHPNVLPATLGEPGSWPGYVAKPVFGWEGAGVEVVTPDFRHRQPAGNTEGQAVVYQKYQPIPAFDGAFPVVGSWIVRDRAAGIGIRESDGPVTDTGARFLPHYMAAPRSTPEQVEAWLRE